MGLSASLFYDPADSEKQTLHRRIIPSEEQFEDQRDRWNALADYLVAELGKRSGYPINTWLQGSYKFGTQVRGAHKGEEFDIDLGVYYRWSGNPNEGDYEPGVLKSMVQGALRSYDADGVLETVTPPKDRCCRIRFAGDFHIDVPAYHLDPDRDERQLATATNRWEDSDPKALYLWFRDRVDETTRTKVRRKVRYLKIWVNLKFPEGPGRPTSTLLTVLAAEASDDIDNQLPDDEALAALLKIIVDRLEKSRIVPNPVDATEDLAQKFSAGDFAAFLSALKEFRSVADEANSAPDEISAADKWSVPFEHFFPLPEIDAELAKGTSVPMRRSIPEIAVEAISQNNPTKRWYGTNQVGPIPKGCAILFKITNPEVLPAGASIHWMVRNEGEEAEGVNDLGHIAGTGFNAKETSAYKGTQYMDCIVRRECPDRC